MQTSQLLILMEDAALSPEGLAKRMGLSNMTVRRWMTGPKDRELPELYAKSAEDAVYQLMIEGAIPADCKSAQWALERGQTLSFQAAITNLGVGKDLEDVVPGQDDRFMLVLSKIGSKGEHRQEVDLGHSKVNGFKKLGQEWFKRIGTMQAAIRSKQVSSVDKMVAYGALFYLICPFDLIPDNIPMFGLMDDYAVLGLAMTYLMSKYVSLHPRVPAA